MDAAWTLDGDETSWASWADDMAGAPVSPFMKKLIKTRRTSPRRNKKG